MKQKVAEADERNRDNPLLKLMRDIAYKPVQLNFHGGLEEQKEKLKNAEAKRIKKQQRNISILRSNTNGK